MKLRNASMAIGLVLLFVTHDTSYAKKEIGKALSDPDRKSAVTKPGSTFKADELVGVHFNPNSYRLTEYFLGKGLLGLNLIMEERVVGDPVVYGKIKRGLDKSILIVSTRRERSQDATAATAMGNFYEVDVGSTTKIYAPGEIYVLPGSDAGAEVIDSDRFSRVVKVSDDSGVTFH